MRRDVKLGIFIVLSIGLVVAVLTGKAITGGSSASSERLTLAIDDAPPNVSTLPGSQASTAPAASPAPNDPIIHELLANLPEQKADLPAPISDTQPPSTPDDEMRQFLTEGEASQTSSHVDDILAILDHSMKTAAADTAPPPPPKPAAPPPHVSTLAKSTLDLIETAALSAQPLSTTTRTSTPAPAEPDTQQSPADILTAIEQKAIGESKTVSSAPPDMAAAADPSFTTHTVREGDSFWTIAERYYGSGVRWQDIAKANPAAKDTALRIGAKLVIPQAIPSENPVPTAQDANLRTYTVREGDSLWSIAAKLYGKGADWEKIARANPAADARNLKVGTILLIP